MRNYNLEKRKFVIGGVAVAIVIGYIVQLFALQIMNDEYKKNADSNAFLNKVQYPARGAIYDRQGRLMVYNQPAYDVTVVMREVEELDTLDFCRTLGISKEFFIKRMADIKNRALNPGYSRYTEQIFMSQLPAEEFAVFQEKIFRFPGFYVQRRTTRQYTYDVAAHVLGDVAEVSKRDIEKDDYYRSGDFIGIQGVERSYEKELRGEKGVEILLRDAHGRIQGRYKDGAFDRRPVAGKDLTFEQRVAAAFALLKQKLSWNGEYLLYAENPLRAVKEGRGSNAELNFILISMLKDLGLKAYPVVMSLRSRGMMPVHFPSEQRLNTFAVAVRHPQANRFVYIDSSMELPLLDVLPTDMLVERARIISNDVPEDKKWVDLSRLSPNRRKTLIEATIDSTLNLRGNIRVVRQGQYASSYLKRKLKGDSNGGGIDESDVTLSQHTDSTEEAWKAEVTERAALEAPVQSAGGDKLYVNPMVIGLMSENPFTQSERDLPVEFPYPLELSVTNILTLPEGYTVEELPQVRTLSTEDNELYLRYRIRQTEDGKRVVLTCSLGIKRCAYPAQYYPQLQQFFDRVVEASEGVLVLSKQ